MTENAPEGRAFVSGQNSFGLKITDKLIFSVEHNL